MLVAQGVADRNYELTNFQLTAVAQPGNGKTAVIGFQDGNIRIRIAAYQLNIRFISIEQDDPDPAPWPR